MAKLTISIGARIDGLKKGLAEAQSKLKRWSGKAAKYTKIAIGVGVAGLAAGLAGVLKKSMQLAAQFEQIKVAFTTMTGSADKAKGLIEELNEFSKATPFSPEQVMKAGRTLLAFGFQAKEVSTTLKLLGDVSAGTGKDLSEMAVIFGQIKGAGRLMGQDLLQLINAGFNPLQIMSEKTGKSMAELKKEMEKGAISFAMVEDAFKTATSAGGIFFNMMEKQSQTLSGQLSTLEGNVNDLMRQFGELTLPELKIVVSGLSEAVQGLQELAEARARLESGEVQGADLGTDVAANAALNGLEILTALVAPALKPLVGKIADEMRAAVADANAASVAAPAKPDVASAKAKKEAAAAEAKKAAEAKQLADDLAAAQAPRDVSSADILAGLNEPIVVPPVVVPPIDITPPEVPPVVVPPVVIPPVEVVPQDADLAKAIGEKVERMYTLPDGVIERIQDAVAKDTAEKLKGKKLTPDEIKKEQEDARKEVDDRKGKVQDLLDKRADDAVDANKKLFADNKRLAQDALGEQLAADKEKAGELQKSVNIAFQPGGKIQSRLAAIGGDRTITLDRQVPQKQLDQLMAVNANIKALETAIKSIDGLSFPGGK